MSNGEISRGTFGVMILGVCALIGVMITSMLDMGNPNPFVLGMGIGLMGGVVFGIYLILSHFRSRKKS